MNIEKILIVGSGTMGEGIAQTFAQAGFDVRLVARREEPLTRAMGQIRQNVQQFIEFDLIHETVEQVVDRIEAMVTTDMAKAVEG
ncbi:MAG TPA: SDR family NAD(P)-dependent oxidoreductase, partial [Thermoleophilia bacterium]|nr:SDR family NAD(P)-dependent oxidoreductase [Thermoleophilia bacterium]